MALVAESDAPRLLLLDGHTSFPGATVPKASYPAFVERNGARMSLAWHLIPALCEVEPNRVVYL
jgi:hypothetical protein